MSAPTMPAVPGITPVFQLGVGDRYDAEAIAGLWGGPGVVDPATWSGPAPQSAWGGQEPLWLDITCDVLEATSYIGRLRSIDRFDVGTATVVVQNLDGWAEYRPPGSTAPLLTVRPGRQLRIGMVADGAEPVWLWRGVVDATEPGYSPAATDTVTLACVDAKGDAGKAQMPPALTPVGYGETANQRVARALRNVSWPIWRQALEVSTVKLLETSLGTKAADEMDRAADSSSGHVYGDLNGRVAYRNSSWMMWADGTPMDGTIGNVEAGDVCPVAWEIGYGRADISTRVIVGRQNETPLVMDDSEAVGELGVETFTRTDLVPIDNFEISRIATRVLHVRSPKWQPRVSAVTLDAATGDGAVADLLMAVSAFKPTRLRCRHMADDGRLAFDANMMVTGVTHTITPNDGWVARLTLDSCEPYRQPANVARWSDAATQWSTDDTWGLTA